MPLLSIKVDFNRTLKRNRLAVSQAMNDTATEMEEALKKNIETPYPPSSRPGQPLHLRTGRLHGSVAVTKKALTITIKSENYGVFHEMGISYPTRGPKKGTKPPVKRPWIQPVMIGEGGDRRRFWQRKINARIRANLK